MLNGAAAADAVSECVERFRLKQAEEQIIEQAVWDTADNTTAETIELSFIDVGQTGLSINGAAISTQASATTVIGTMAS